MLSPLLRTDAIVGHNQSCVVLPNLSRFFIAVSGELLKETDVYGIDQRQLLPCILRRKTGLLRRKSASQ